MSPKTPAFAIAAAALLLAGCQAKVSHPTKTLAEQQVDIEGCSKAANDKYWMDPIAALLNAYDCLEAKGYQRGRSGLETKVQKAVNADRVKNDKPVLPCKVPCTTKR